MIVIHKVEVRMDRFIAEMQPCDEVLSVGVQKNQPFMWVKKNNYKNPFLTLEEEAFANVQTRTFHCFMTGEEIPSNLSLKFIGTFLLNEGTFVLHLFEVI